MQSLNDKKSNQSQEISQVRLGFLLNDYLFKFDIILITRRVIEVHHG